MLQDKDVQLARFQTLLEANLLAWKEEGWSGETLKLAAQSGLLSAYSEGIELEAEIRFRLWPFGSLSVTRQAEAGYEKPFGLLGEAL